MLREIYKSFKRKRHSLRLIRLLLFYVLRNNVLAASMKQSRTSIKDWVKTLLTLTAVNILSTSSVTFSIKMCS